VSNLINEFSWSPSRGKRLEECQRYYWLTCYGFWNGWERDASDRAKKLYILKGLRNRHTWPGVVVHDAIKYLLENNADVKPDEFLEEVRLRMRRDFHASSKKTYYYVRKSFGLTEHEYAEDIPAQWWAEAWDKVRTCLDHWFSMGVTTRMLLAGMERWKPIDEKSSFPFHGVTCWVAPDAAFTRPEDGKLELIDWKTGKPRSSDVEQLGFYGLFAQEKWGAKPGEMVGRLVYLGEDREQEFVIGEEELEIAREQIRADVAKLRLKLVDQDITRNEAIEENFPKTKDLRTCEQCALRIDCWPGGQVGEKELEEW
jgi:hypothetical protein